MGEMRARWRRGRGGDEWVCASGRGYIAGGGSMQEHERVLGHTVRRHSCAQSELAEASSPACPGYLLIVKMV